MPRSLNVSFAGNPLGQAREESAEPVGRWLVECVVGQLHDRPATPINNWRDVGWSVVLERSGETVEFVVSQTRGGRVRNSCAGRTAWAPAFAGATE